MKTSRHTDEEIAQLLQEAQAGIPIDDICRSAHVSLRTFYRWRKRLGGLAPPALHRLQSLESENRRLLRQIQRLKAERSPAHPTKAGGQGAFRQRSEFGAPDQPRETQNAAATPANVGRCGTVIGRFSSVRTGR
jgi:putative transposase